MRHQDLVNYFIDCLGYSEEDLIGYSANDLEGMLTPTQLIDCKNFNN